MGFYANNNDAAPTSAVKTPAVYNVVMTNADTQYSQALPAGCKRFSLSVQAGDSTKNYRVAFVTGKVATPTAPYIQLPCDIEYPEDHLNLDATTLFFACSEAGKVAQIIAWV